MKSSLIITLSNSSPLALWTVPKMKSGKSNTQAQRSMTHVVASTGGLCF